MQIVNVSQKDTGNQCFKLSKAINELFPGIHESRAFARQRPTFTAFDQDVLWSARWGNGRVPAWVVDYWANADVIHRHVFWKRCLGWPSPAVQAGRVMHQHGRMGPAVKPQHVKDEDARLKQIRVVATLNLLQWVGERFDRWFPPPMDIARIDAIVKEHRKPKKCLVVCHAPTQRRLKHTVLFLYVMKEIRKKYPQVRVQLVEGKPHTECLRLCANADIYFDQLLLQYGTAGLEAMTMGRPVVAGCDNVTWKRMVRFFGEPPFVRATPATLFKTIEKLVADHQYREYMGLLGRRYIETHHSFEHVARLAIGTYKEAKRWMSCSAR